MIFYKFHENRIYQKDKKALRRRPRHLVSPKQEKDWEYSFYHYKPKYQPNTIHCKGMVFGGSQEP